MKAGYNIAKNSWDVSYDVNKYGRYIAYKIFYYVWCQTYNISENGKWMFNTVAEVGKNLV